MQTDHKPLNPIWKISIAAARPWLQQLLLQLAKYDLELMYLKGKDNVIAGVLIWVNLIKPEPTDKDYFDTILVHHIRCSSYRVSTRESEGGDAGWTSAQLAKIPSIPGMARCKEKYSRRHPIILELQGWAVWVNPQCPQTSNSSIPEAGIPWETYTLCT